MHELRRRQEITGDLIYLIGTRRVGRCQDLRRDSTATLGPFDPDVCELMQREDEVLVERVTSCALERLLA